VKNPKILHSFYKFFAFPIANLILWNNGSHHLLNISCFFWIYMLSIELMQVPHYVWMQELVAFHEYRKKCYPTSYMWHKVSEEISTHCLCFDNTILIILFLRHLKWIIAFFPNRTIRISSSLSHILSNQRWTLQVLLFAYSLWLLFANSSRILVITS
jgi:hypothetical protein